MLNSYCGPAIQNPNRPRCPLRPLRPPRTRYRPRNHLPRRLGRDDHLGRLDGRQVQDPTPGSIQRRRCRVHVGGRVGEGVYRGGVLVVYDLCRR